MILDKIFIHLRKTGSTKKYLASRVLTWWGKTFIGAPKPEQIPGPDESVKKRISDTYFDMPVDRPPTKRNRNWEISQLWAAQLRDEEEKPVSYAAYIYSVLICTVLIAAGGAVGSATAKADDWWQQRQAQAKAEREAKYEAQREESIAKWTEQAQAYSANKCVEEANKLRIRDEREASDRYSAIMNGCRAKQEEIAQIGQGLSLKACEQWGLGIAKDREKGGSATWADELVFTDGCFSRFRSELRQINQQAGGHTPIEVDMSIFPGH